MFTDTTYKRVLSAMKVSTGSLLLSSLSAVCLAVNAVDYDIPQQSLGDALEQFSRQSDAQIIYSSENVSGKSNNPIKGDYDELEALNLLLKDSGLTHSIDENNVIVIHTADSRLSLGSQESQEGDEAVEKKSDRAKYIDEIIVTAEKRAESLQDIPIAISAFSGQDMERSGVSGIRDLKQLVPSLQFGESPAAVRVSIRGVGSELPNVGNEAGVTISQDGVPFFSPYMFDASFMDVERVEVLRGPQGTISGRNATGGAINIYSRLPSEELEAGVEVTLGNYNHREVEGYLSGPLVEDKLLARVVVNTQKADGWIENTLRNEEHNDADKLQARVSLLAHLSDSVEASLILESIKDKSSPLWNLDLGRARPDELSIPEAFGVPQSTLDWDALEYQADHADTRDFENQKSIFKLVWDISSSASLTSTTGYMSQDRSHHQVDADATVAFIDSYEPIEFNLWQVSQELTLAAELSEQLDFILGGFYMRAEAEEPLQIVRPTIPPGDLVLSVDQDLTSYALYTQWRYRFNDEFRLTLGGRYTHDEKDYVEDLIFFGSTIISPINDSWEAFTPRVAVDYSPNEDQTVYASISRGFKSGGVNTFGKQVFNPEYVWSYEIGAKSSWLDRQFNTGIAAFYMDYTDLQQTVRRPSPLTGSPTNYIENAGAAKIAGIEVEFEARITEQLTLSGGGTWYAESSFEDLESIDQSIYPELGLQDLDGNQLVRVPERQFNLSGEYVVLLGNGLRGVLKADYQWQDRIFFSIYNYRTDAQESYALLNLSAALESESGTWSIVAFGRNLTDEQYISNSAAGREGSGVGRAGTVGAPRMYGVSLAYKF